VDRGKENVTSADVSIHLGDLRGFMEAVSNVTERDLDLFLHSPGGSAEAAEAAMAYLRTRFDHIRVIVPLAAMSAATMMALGADEHERHGGQNHSSARYTTSTGTTPTCASAGEPSPTARKEKPRQPGRDSPKDRNDTLLPPIALHRASGRATELGPLGLAGFAHLVGCLKR